MAYPTPIVEIAFDDGPYVASPTWTNVTAYVLDATVDRGRSDEWATEFTGTAQIRLDNTTRRFDPFYTAGPYYGKLLPRRQIRIRATSGATTYDVFRGYVDGWPVTFTNGVYWSEVVLQCYDALALLSESALPVDWSDEYIQSTNPTNYYRFLNPSNPTTPTALYITDEGSAGDNLRPNVAGQYQNVDALAPGLPAKALNVGGAFLWYLKSVSQANATSFTIAAWVQFGTNQRASSIEFACGRFVAIYLNPTTSRITVEYETGTLLVTYTGGYLDNSVPHFVAFTVSPTFGTVSLRVDGVVQTTTNTTAASTFTSTDTLFLNKSVYQQVITWKGGVSGNVLDEIYLRGAALFDETTTERVDRLITQTDFPTSRVTAPASPYGQVLQITDDAPPVSSELNITANSEAAPLFCKRNGDLVLFDRYQQFTQSTSYTSQQTFGTGGITIGPEIEIRKDAETIRNQFDISYSAEAVVAVDKPPSVTTYGPRDQGISTWAATKQDAENIGQLWAGLGQFPSTTFTPFQVNVSNVTADWNKVLALELCDRVTVKVSPNVGNAIEEPALIQRVTHEITPGEWKTTLTTSVRLAYGFQVDRDYVDGPKYIIYSEA